MHFWTSQQEIKCTWVWHIFLRFAKSGLLHFLRIMLMRHFWKFSARLNARLLQQKWLKVKLGKTLPLRAQFKWLLLFLISFLIRRGKWIFLENFSLLFMATGGCPKSLDLFFCRTSLPLASTRWVQLTLSSLCPLFQAVLSINLCNIKRKCVRSKYGTSVQCNPPPPKSCTFTGQNFNKCSMIH